MNSENRNFLLAVAFSFLILLLYPLYLKWISPKSSITTNENAPATSNQTVPSQSTFQVAKSMLPAPVNENNYHFSNSHFDVEFSDRGAAITKLALTQWGRKTKGKEAVLINREEAGKPSFIVTLPGQGIDFGNRIFKLERLDVSTGEVGFVAEEPGKWLIRKQYRFQPDRPTFSLDTTIENLSGSEQTASIQLTAHLISARDPYNQRESGSFISLPDKLIFSKAYKMQKKPALIEGKILWQILARHFFALVIYPDSPAVLSKTNVEQGKILETAIQFDPQQVLPNAKIERSFLIYAGPKYYRDLKSFGHGFERILSQGFFGVFKFWLLIALQWMHQLVGNYGWAIVLITIAIKLLFSPLTHMSFESMKKMQALQPKLKSLQEQHKNDQAKLSKEMMELYRKHKVNPMGGCLPMVLQIPVFIAFYQVLAQTAEFQGEPFIWWIRDLSEPDRAWTLPFALPFLGDAVNVLPLLMLGSMIWQQRLTPQTATSPEQQQMMMFMPVIFGFIFYNLPSGLVLYWFVNNLLSIFHQLFVKGKALPHHEET